MNNLLPPSELWLVEICAIIFLLTSINSSPGKLSRKKVFGITATISGLLAIITSIFWGVGHAWSLPSLLGKFITLLIVCSLPLFSVAGAFLVCQRFQLSKLASSLIAITAGLVAVVPMVIIGIILACLLTGDCL